MVSSEGNLFYSVDLLYHVCHFTFYYNKIGGAFVYGDALLTLEMFIDWIKTWKSNHGVNTQILSLEYSKLNLRFVKIIVIYLIFIKFT
jgi:hypothetical protein